MNYLRDNKHDSTAESTDEGRGEHHLDTAGKHCHEPRGREGKRGYEQHPLATEAHGESTQHAAEEGSQEGQAGNPRGLLLAHCEDPARRVGHSGREPVLLFLERVHGWRAVALTEPGREGTQRYGERRQDLRDGKQWDCKNLLGSLRWETDCARIFWVSTAGNSEIVQKFTGVSTAGNTEIVQEFTGVSTAGNDFVQEFTGVSTTGSSEIV